MGWLAEVTAKSAACARPIVTGSRYKVCVPLVFSIVYVRVIGLPTDVFPNCVKSVRLGVVSPSVIETPFPRTFNLYGDPRTLHSEVIRIFIGIIIYDIDRGITCCAASTTSGQPHCECRCSSGGTGVVGAETRLKSPLSPPVNVGVPRFRGPVPVF